MQEGQSYSGSAKQSLARHFGAFLKVLRHRHGIRQLDVLIQLVGWTQANYSRLETDELAPAFDQLVPLYLALRKAGVELTPQDRQQFLTLARVRIEAKRSHLERKTDQQWDELRLQLSRIDHGLPNAMPHRQCLVDTPRLLETRHLIGREDWLASVTASLQGALPKKLVVLQGPGGMGKSSELHRIALHFLSPVSPQPHVILCELPSVERRSEPEHALDLFLGTLLAEVGPPDAVLHLAAPEVRVKFALTCLEKGTRPLLFLVDNAEQLLNGEGKLATCWERFLHLFLRRRHAASLVLATKEWPGWFAGERLFLSERLVPSLSVEEGVTLLQRLGLATVPIMYLQQASEVVGGLPLCLEWLASLVQEPIWLDSWEMFDDFGLQEDADETDNLLTRRLRHLLDDPILFGGPIADRLTPLLAHVIEKRLSAESAEVLNILALAKSPLGKEALQVICSRPQLLKELRAVSLLAAHPQRVQVLPMVAAGVRARLSTEQQEYFEEKLIEAYLQWIDKGKPDNREIGDVIAELATLYLKHHRLLDAAQHLILHGWMSFNQGHGLRLAHLAHEVLQQVDWRQTEELECASLILMKILFPFLGKPSDPQKYIDYQRIREAVLVGRIVLQMETEGYLIQLFMLDAMNQSQFEDAQAVLETYLTHLEERGMAHMKQHSSVIQKRATLLGRWCEYAEEQGEMQKAQILREQAIAIYRQGDVLLSSQEGKSPLNRNIRLRRLAGWLNNLGYHLNRIGQYEEALQVIERAITLHEQGYGYVGVLAASYSEKSQILMELGHFQEALCFDEKALLETRRWTNAGYAPSQDDIWVYNINRGRLYLRVGRIDEAEQLLREAFPHIQPRRQIYCMFAKDALEEIKELRHQALFTQKANI